MKEGWSQTKFKLGKNFALAAAKAGFSAVKRAVPSVSGLDLTVLSTLPLIVGVGG
jgi:hypothetical protein